MVDQPYTSLPNAAPAPGYAPAGYPSLSAPPGYVPPQQPYVAPMASPGSIQPPAPMMANPPPVVVAYTALPGSMPATEWVPGMPSPLMRCPRCNFQGQSALTRHLSNSMCCTGTIIGLIIPVVGCIVCCVAQEYTPSCPTCGMALYADRYCC